MILYMIIKEYSNFYRVYRTCEQTGSCDHVAAQEDQNLLMTNKRPNILFRPMTVSYIYLLTNDVLFDIFSWQYTKGILYE